MLPQVVVHSSLTIVTHYYGHRIVVSKCLKYFGHTDYRFKIGGKVIANRNGIRYQSKFYFTSPKNGPKIILIFRGI